MSNRYKMRVVRGDGLGKCPHYISETAIETTDVIPDLGRAARNLAGVFCLDAKDVDEDDDIVVEDVENGVMLTISEDRDGGVDPWLVVRLWKEESK